MGLMISSQILDRYRVEADNEGSKSLTTIDSTKENVRVKHG